MNVCVTGRETCTSNCATGNNSYACVSGRKELTRNLDCFITSKKDTVRTLTVNSCVVNHAHSVTGLPQKKGVIHNYCHLYPEIKHVKDVSYVDQSSSVKCLKYPNCCTISPCRDQITPVLEEIGSPRRQPQSINSPQRKLHSSPPVLAQLDQVTHNNKLLCNPHRNLYRWRHCISC